MAAVVNYTVTAEELDRIIDLASKNAVKAFVNEQRKHERYLQEEKHKRVKKALQSYRRTKILVGSERMLSPQEMRETRYNFLCDLMGMARETRTEDLIIARDENRKRNIFYLGAIEGADRMYREEVLKGTSSEDIRRYEEMHDFYLGDEEVTVAELAERENISEKTVYKDLNIACEIMAEYIVGM